ncbi:hypothetical protein [Streptomyces nigra]|uniref:hypothetical protein n=1 Tax=Streptomyces nigra TaxID=1827580 RepID=UPI00364CC378
MGSEQHVCPDCGQPVETVVRRHKTLGAWVPTWVPGPCRNPGCAAHSEGAAEQQHDRPARPGEPAASGGPTPPGSPAASPEKTTATES